MAGLIQQGMAPSDVEDAMQQAPAAQQPPMPAEGAAPPPEMEEAQEGGDAPEDDPGFTQAMAFAMEALYKRKAAKDIATTLRDSGSTVDALADTAYNIVSIVDEKTEGAVSDDLLALFASRILEEVVEIAQAAGVEVKPSDIALALKKMILRFLGEHGMDTTQLEQAMDQVNPEEFNRMATEA
jgi:hypothetical protein